MVDVPCGNRSFTYVKNPNRFERMDSMGTGYYFGKHLELVSTLRRFLACPSLRVLVVPAALPRCSLDAPSTLLTPLSFYSAVHPPRSNFKSPAAIFPVFPLRHRYSWAIDPQLAARCCVSLLSMFPPPDRCLFAYRYRRCGVATCSSIFVCPSIALTFVSECGEDFAFTLTNTCIRLSLCYIF